MPAPVTVFDNPELLGRALAAEILERLRQARRGGRRYILGCPGGRSLRSTYAALADLVGRANEDLNHVVVAMMDEYCLPAAHGYEPCSPDAHYSCRRFAAEEICAPLGAGLAPNRRIPPHHVWVPDPADAPGYDRKLTDAGGVDLFLLASGASDGHVAFNPPGSRLDDGSKVVTLAEATRRDNMATFPAFTSLDEVPKFGVSVGLGSIRRLSREVVLVIHGEHKRAAARRVWSTTSFDPAWPATVVHACSQARIFLDKAAAAP